MDNFFFVVMTLVGRSLQDLRMEMPSQKFSVTTSLSVGVKCLEALEDLHSIEYIYRNPSSPLSKQILGELTPTNYAVGLPGLGESRRIYLLDLGTARKFVSEDGSIKKQRALVGFRTNTLKYAPLAFHENRELSRKDDIEAWLYMLVEFIRGSLPWRNTKVLLLML
jgi:tau tubulin kinase